MGTVVAGGRRLLDGLLTAWAAVTFTFFALRLAAGDPLAGLLSQGLATPEQVEALRVSLGLDQPLMQQYLAFLRGIFRGNFATSLYTGREVTQVVLEQFPATAQLALLSLGLAMIFGLFFLYLAWKYHMPAAAQLPTPACSMTISISRSNRCSSSSSSA